jgi:hypothetical protein
MKIAKLDASLLFSTRTQAIFIAARLPGVDATTIGEGPLSGLPFATRNTQSEEESEDR